MYTIDTVIPYGTFMREANGRARARRLSERDYLRYLRAYERAQEHATDGEGSQAYYRDADAGSVVDTHGHATTTAQWGVWTTNAGAVVSVVGRVHIYGPSVPPAFYGGERSYLQAFREGNVTDAPAPVTVYTINTTLRPAFGPEPRGV